MSERERDHMTQGPTAVTDIHKHVEEGKAERERMKGGPVINK